MPQSLHDIKIDPRNEDILININGVLIAACRSDGLRL